MRNYGLITIFILTLCISFSLLAQDDYLVDISKVFPEEIQITGFAISSEQDVKVKAAIISPRRNYREFHFSYAWILNAETRELVWELKNGEIEERDRYKITYTGEFELKPGTYEVYYSTYPHFNFEDDFYYQWGARGFFSGLFNAVFNDDDEDERYRYFEELYEELYFRLEGQGVSLSSDQVTENQEALKGKAFLSFTSLRDDEFEEQIFEVKQPVELRVYALGEARRDGEYDFGTIINLRTRERVWQLTYRGSDDAGGARKNRLADETITLEPGLYKSLYVTDDSHSYRRWNSAPPFDPNFWGLTLWAQGDAAGNLVKLDEDVDLNQSTVAEFTRVRDEEYLVKGFTLKKPLNLQIYALGEGSDGEMYDYGWIVDVKTRKRVWEMDYYDTEPAGGADKNRMFDGVIKLEPGNYMVYYITDDSHAYRDWNMSPPYDKKSWGITISVLDESYSDGDIVAYEEEEDPNTLARIIRVRDDERRKSQFTVKKDGYVYVYAIGEGSYDEMHDYAWIENANTGRVVWEMTYRKTDRAGGARKNRLFDDRVYLEAGDYYLYYETDDSHSFNDWNDRPPSDPFNWGVTVSILEDD